MRSGPFAADERAVSNTLGYILLFGIVLASITAVGTLGVQALEETRQGTLQENAEYTMTSVATAVGDVHEQNVPRTSRVRLATGSLQTGDPVDLTVTVDVDQDGFGDSDDETLTATARPLVYTADDVRIVYVAGAVFRFQDRGEVVVREPKHGLGGSQAVLQLPATQFPNSGRIVSGSNAQVVLYRDSNSLEVVHESVDTDSHDVRLEIQASSDRQAGLWQSALGDRFNDGCSVASSTVTCDHNGVDGVVARSTVTQVELHT